MANMATGQKVQVGWQASVTANALQVIDKTPLIMASKVVSQSTGTVKASAGSLIMIIGTTGGDMQLMDGAALVQRPAVVANTIISYPWPGLYFGTSISISASAAVATVVYV